MTQKPKSGDIIRIIYNEGYAGDGVVRVRQPLPDGMLVSPTHRHGLNFIDWASIKSWEKK